MTLKICEAAAFVPGGRIQDFTKTITNSANGIYNVKKESYATSHAFKNQQCVKEFMQFAAF